MKNPALVKSLQRAFESEAGTHIIFSLLFPLASSATVTDSQCRLWEASKTVNTAILGQARLFARWISIIAASSCGLPRFRQSHLNILWSEPTWHSPLLKCRVSSLRFRHANRCSLNYCEVYTGTGYWQFKQCAKHGLGAESECRTSLRSELGTPSTCSQICCNGSYKYIARHSTAQSGSIERLLYCYILYWDDLWARLSIYGIKIIIIM